MSKQLFRFSPADDISTVMQRNKAWSERLSISRPSLFPTNGQGQSPHILWLGCSDSRVSESCLDLLPGEVFTHRNIANMVHRSDMSVQSVLQFAIQVLHVKHIILCGHYDCGGVKASFLDNEDGGLGLVGEWIADIRELRKERQQVLDKIASTTERLEYMSEQNVQLQFGNLMANEIVSGAVQAGDLQVHCVIYDVKTGQLKEISHA